MPTKRTHIPFTIIFLKEAHYFFRLKRKNSGIKKELKTRLKKKIFGNLLKENY